MAESLIIDASASKAEKYEQLIPQIKALVTGEENMVANMANVSAALRSVFGFFWVGFYIVEGEQLVLGPFQGPIACTRIPKGRGVCGQAWEKEETQLVLDVDAFPGHIACSSASKSEVVVPVISGGKAIAVLDVDSDKLNDFDETDKKYLELLMKEVF
ncbi:diguanylate cyclase [Fulvitalea axinellae]|uniref:Diguanylate cyclase n=1 Tax=Fulvitalea axinellae TaxID=1182444 RepID=A0AAU9CSE3_9BACT|nr:diguanylate cyclase [Fulvitalea axinellae]